MKNDNDSLGNRMKAYEEVNLHRLIRRMPLIIRVDGKAFHTLTKKMRFEKPFDKNMMDAMADTARTLIAEIQGSKLAYVQSDEISILATDYEDLETQAWFDKNLQKIVSVSASVATSNFNMYMRTVDDQLPDGLFDSRAFVLPKEEVCNYLIWRQKDATRNSIQGVGQANFSHKEISGLNNDHLQEKMFQEKQINWNDFDTWKKRGVCLYKVPVTKTVKNFITGVEEPVIRTEIKIDWEIPIFTQDRNYVGKWL